MFFMNEKLKWVSWCSIIGGAVTRKEGPREKLVITDNFVDKCGETRTKNK